ncbi:MAG TPA: cytochrome c-type biogenesis protein CcmH [Terriglobales bacterium]|jgi:cytochrome c-type biogenesis protein CcmH|nr:cytochrome c-type biogenesis protein CcmH [Terriglobales bacterium]
MSRLNRFRIVGSLLLGVLLLMGASDNSSRTDRLGHQMMCMCSCSQILMECNHVGCTYSDTMRNELTAGVDAGKSDSEVLAMFVEKYGTTVLAAPTHSGFDRVAWLLPYIALIVGLGGVAFVVRAWHKRRVPATVAATSGLSTADLSRLREQARKETDL